MCGPWAIPLALTAAGSVAQYMGQRKADRAQSRAFSQERDRQNAMSAEQQARFADSLAKTQELIDPAARQKAEDARADALTAVVKPASDNASFLPGASDAPSIVSAESEKAGAASESNSMNLAQTLAALGAPDNQLLDTNIQIGRDSGSINQLNSFKRGSLTANDAEMRAAAMKGSFLRGVGGLAQTIGKAWLGSTLAPVGGTEAWGGATGQAGLPPIY